MSLRELRTVSLENALNYLDLLAEQKPEKLERAAARWHDRLKTEAPILTLAESQLALAALASLCAGERDAVEIRAAAQAGATDGGDACGILSCSDALSPLSGEEPFPGRFS